MNDNILAINIPNIVSITIMAVVGVLVLGVIAKAVKQGGGAKTTQAAAS